MSLLDAKGEWIKSKARELGFLSAGYARAEAMPDEAERLRQWLGLGYQGKMQYLENHFEKRTDPTKLVPGTRSIISLAYNYHTEEKQKDPEAPKISSYAYGRDYHKLIKKKLKSLCRSIEEEFGSFEYRFFVDSAPVLERDWALRAGLGWIGKNTLLIHPKKGSHFFLAELFVDFDLPYDAPMSDYCGTCRRCIDACPTDAIAGNGYVLNASRCISYLTIELKDEIPEEFQPQMENWIFGCDICQDVCPWNRFSEEHQEVEFQPRGDLLDLSKSDWQNLSEEKFESLFKGSAVKRAGYKGLKRNIEFVSKDKKA
jgi:epoxyqueuosine reductase